MVFRHINKDLQERRYHNNFIDDNIASLMGVSERSIYRWQANVEHYGSVIPPLNPFEGHPPLLHAEAMNNLLVVAHDLSISRSQVHQVIKYCGIIYKLMSHAAAERDEQAREMLWIGNTSKDDRTVYCHYGIQL
ncbi:hypothetical protein IW261DRAFT_1582691 [Armillaria novae-zelandiae]|uniref:Uncharacterized protein n=1 Tax=Armillaria novae-zelandiae TaxID=153914 RepID=A0AA39PIX2_9AGAR|nr:hypothetical protein IW261DRAFT_1582691 [Armillaria novae-zelandiae]